MNALLMYYASAIIVAFLHEFLHYITGKLLGHSPKLIVKFPQGIGFYINDNELSKGEAIIITLSPQIITLTLVSSAIIMSSIIIRIILGVLAFANIASSVYDFRELYIFMRNYEKLTDKQGDNR